VILGKPGAGKTTFLKYLTLQALDGNLKQSGIPIFVGLKEWSDSGQSLIDFIVDIFDVCDFPNAHPFVVRLLTQGRALILLDGFDEVSAQKIDKVVRDVRRLASKYSRNKFVLSCRLAAYSHFLENFTEVEIADFSLRQIEAFVNNWFGKRSAKANACLKALNENTQIRELASVPLLVTLLCLAFDETMSFPANRAELYKEALDALLKKWDASRSIKRDEIYRHLSLRRRESLFSRIAVQTFEANQYFIPQRDLERQILNYIRNLPEAGSETLEVDSENVPKSIEAQHGTSGVTQNRPCKFTSKPAI
jgi:predicted NACHT family NTPase